MGRIKRINGKLYDFGTSNISFLQLAKDLKTIGVKNWYFMLEIKDPSVLQINPYSINDSGSTTLSKDEVSRVISECTRNLWYYLREVCRIPDPGNPAGVPYKANRGNIAQAWCIFNGIDSWLCLPRQQGKTQSAIAVFAHAYSFGTSNTSMIFINKLVPDAKTNLSRLKDQLDLLPEYMRFESYYSEEDGKVTKMIKNATEMRHPVTKNKIVVKAGSATPEAAMSLARGLTAPLLHYDEPEFTPNIDIVVDNSISTFDTAARASKRNNAMYARVFTCTPGDLDTNAGIGSQKIIDKTVKWSDKMYDMTREEMEEFAAAGNSNRIVYIEFHYYQIGLTEEWLKELVDKSTDPLTARRELLLQRLHGSSLSPYTPEDIDYIADHIKEPIKIIFLCGFYQFFIYEEFDPVIPYIVGVDCSTGTVKDNNAICVINPYTTKVVAEFECSYIGETNYERLLIELVTQHIPRAILCIERNSVGDGIIDHLLESRISSNLYYDRDLDLVNSNKKQYESHTSMLKHQASLKTYYGVYTQGASREQMFSILANRIKDNKDDFVGKLVSRDISRLVRATSGKIVAGNGFHDDSVMAYLIGMYVYTHGNNLPAFGYIPGARHEEEKNTGLQRSKEQLYDVLPQEVADAVYEQETKQDVSYEEILRNAIMSSQKETSRLMKSSINMDNRVNVDDLNVYDNDNDMDLSLFDDLNNLHGSDDDGFPW